MPSFLPPVLSIAHHLADQFPHALQRMEKTRDVSELLTFFSDDAVLSRSGGGHKQSGQAGVQKFWQEYLHCFAEVHSEFTHLHMSARALILEWVSVGRHADGQPLSYCGVSILAFNPDGQITEFRTYYDSTSLTGTNRACCSNV